MVSSDISVEMQELYGCAVPLPGIGVGISSVAVHPQNRIYLPVLSLPDSSCTHGDRFCLPCSKKKRDDDRDICPVFAAVSSVFSCFIRDCSGEGLCGSGTEVVPGLERERGQYLKKTVI